jgi:DNA modification methylase
MTNLAIEQMKTSALKPYARNARTHSKKQVKQIAESIKGFGFNNPVLISDDNEIVAGHGRYAAAKHLGLETVPCVRLSHLTPEQRRAYVLADNKLALNAGWDQELLAIELQDLKALEVNIELTGFSLPEVDIILEEVKASDPNDADDLDDEIPEVPKQAITKLADVWVLGRHRLICGDARDPNVYLQLLGDERADLLLTDPPYNVPIDGNVCGKGKVRHAEFAMASGEMSSSEFTAFLEASLGSATAHCREGAVTFTFMDWRHIKEVTAATEALGLTPLNLCIWNKTNGAQGSLYRSKHELVFVHKVGKAPHINNVQLGKFGRYRTNVWDYAGISARTKTRAEELAMHPTVKPVAMLRDAILDCSNRGDIILDCFGGSGSTLIAADKSGRSARLIEYDPHYCDVIIQRWEKLSGKEAVRMTSDHDPNPEASHDTAEMMQ